MRGHLLEHQEVHLVVEPVDDAVEDEQLPGGPAMHQLVQQHVALHQEHRGQERTGAWLGSGLGLGLGLRLGLGLGLGVTLAALY